jgi:hypothetical protein
MVGLLDIAPAGQTVTIRGSAVDVTGISARGLVMLMTRFPDLYALLDGQSLDPAAIVKFGGDVVAAILAAGTGKPGDLDAEKVADQLSIDEQLILIAAILKETLPNGVDPFVEKLQAVGASLGLRGVAAEQGNSPAPSKD